MGMEKMPQAQEHEEIQKERVVSDVELVKRGAEFKKEGRPEMTTEQVGAAKEEMSSGSPENEPQLDWEYRENLYDSGEIIVDVFNKEGKIVAYYEYGHHAGGDGGYESYEELHILDKTVLLENIIKCLNTFGNHSVGRIDDHDSFNQGKECPIFYDIENQSPRPKGDGV